ncbi:phosphonate transport system ATP-binding protein [Virgibacillus natechei]|uniref:Phosphonate transport system ATP-binding protein n=1 Tax=Virgibacillus natechei TaxID=1216297 RepID=A0ABS4ICY5_9BACI|nr:phosphonate ABC transporter ATP-binding protein [Virgibacillus natechei]MBP1968510.1 phosphonate transport system ATP-binding protein [Virgibacillus natechei]UZD13626.1 phosphonate ABC transporter ATP-binding protein [Virgibacillus natechei]
MEDVFLETRELTKVYLDGTEALKKISLTFKQGELVSIIGPSGAGKSTFLRSINCLNKPTSGEVLFQNQNITRANGKKLRLIRRQIGMVFQDFNLIKRSSTIRNVLHGRLGYMSSLKGGIGRFSEYDVHEGLAILKRVGLEDHAFKRADELSGGQQQRVGIARAIAQKPSLILADEPIASLDPSSSNNVMNYLKKISEEDGITTIVNLHQVDFAKHFAHRIIGIKAGEVVFDGRPNELSNLMIDDIYFQGDRTYEYTS